MISTNRGEQLKPLSKIASGGEMSRIMLAFKKIVGDYDEIPTLIFDEIDTGISGITASIVGRKLMQIAESHQVICITHLPQIAACGQHNYRIFKESDESKTFTTVQALDGSQTVDEIARLLGGANITDVTIQSARELIASSK
jgi:DNA repair protein RecN (Recombination protein N)